MVLPEKFKTNIRIIDEQHKELFDMIKKIKMINDDRDELKLVLTELVQYTKYHFKTEEEFCKKFDMELYERQKRYHSWVRQILEQSLELIDEDVVITELREEVSALIEKWLKNHILKDDIKLREYSGN
ncbi:MAG: hemerythrin domain-containing protein [Proteocatella sp.]